MNKLNILAATFIAASLTIKSNLNTQAETFNYFIDFATKEVANFNDYEQLFFSYTSGYYNHVRVIMSGSASLSGSCASVPQYPLDLELRYNLNGGSASTIFTKAYDHPCSNTATPFVVDSGYLRFIDIPVSQLVSYVINDDNDFITWMPRLKTIDFSLLSGRTLTISNISFQIEYQIIYDTIYLFNTFVSDTKYNGRNSSGWTSSFYTAGVNVDYIYGTNINTSRTYQVNNTNDANIGTTRKKYAVNVPSVSFIGNIIGIKNVNNSVSSLFRNMTGGGSNFFIEDNFRFYYLNGASAQVPITSVPQFNFEYQECGGFLGIDIPCMLNNAMAWLTNDAPIISDAFTLLNTGINLAAQGIGVIGNFIASSNIVVWIIVLGFGIIAVRWFLK
jgi:hypothetical protein